MPPAYLYLDSGQKPQGPHSLEELRAMVADGRLPATTVAAPVGSQDWQLVKGPQLTPPSLSPSAPLPPPTPPPSVAAAPSLPTHLPPSPPAPSGASPGPASPPPTSRPRPVAQTPSRLTPSAAGTVPASNLGHLPPRPFPWRRLAAVIAVLLLGGLVAVDGLLSWPITGKLKQMAGLTGRPSPSARWYLFGHSFGQRHASVLAALGTGHEVQPGDLAYTLKALGVPNPPPKQFEICLEGFRDGMAGQKARFVLPTDGVEDPFPDALRGL